MREMFHLLHALKEVEAFQDSSFFYFADLLNVYCSSNVFRFHMVC